MVSQTFTQTKGSRIISALDRRGRKFFDRTLVYITNHIVSKIVFIHIRLAWYRRVMGFHIGKNSSILTDFRVATRGNIDIGRNSTINNHCRFDNRRPIAIGDNVSVTYGTTIFTKGHDIDSPTFATSGAPVTIDDLVWLCALVIVLPGVTIGRGAVVLPGSVVTKSVKPLHVVGGNPAAYIRDRPARLDYSPIHKAWVPFFG